MPSECRKHIESTGYQSLYMAQGLILRANGLPFSCRERAADALQKANDSRAKRSAATAGWAVFSGMASI
jgi:hypothetical protein